MGHSGSKAVWGAALALWLLTPSAAGASSGPGKIDRALQSASSSDTPKQVIIRTKPGAKSSVKHKLARRGMAASEMRLISALGARLDASEVQALAADPDVESVSIDAVVTASASGDVDMTSASGLKTSLGIGDWFSGSSVTVAVIDSGVQSMSDFSGRILGQYDFTQGKSGLPMLPLDEYGHGTHVAGLIGSSGATSSGRYGGVAPGVKLLSLKVLDKRGAGRTSDVMRALEFAVANKDRFGIKIVNLSLGHPIYESVATDPLVQAVEAAVRSGLIVVAAAGNFGTNPTTGLPGYGGIASPGNAPSAITVGAANTAGTTTRADDRVASYSSRGPSWYDAIAKPDILAPGHSLISNEIDLSTLALEYPSQIVREGSRKFLRLNGSSMATGVVSGLIAAMFDATQYGAYKRWEATQTSRRSTFPGVPALTPNAVKALLQYSATPLRDGAGARYDALTQGSGLLNGQGALALAYLTDTTKAAGAFWMTSSMPASTDFGGVSEAWSESLLWGTRRIQGSSLIDFNQAAWDDNIVWGTGELDNIVWGAVSGDDDNIVWGTLFGDDDNIVWGTSVLNDVFWSGNAELAENIVWGTAADWDDNIVWGTNLLGFFDGDNIVWGTMEDGLDNIVWGTLDDDNIVWGTSANKVLGMGTSLGGGL